MLSCPLCIYCPRSANARYMRHAIPHAKRPDAQACLCGACCVKEVVVPCELKGVHRDLHEKRHDCALLDKDDFLSCPLVTRSEAAGLRGKGITRPIRLAWRVRCSHSTVSHLDAIQASSAQPWPPAAQPAKHASSQASQARDTRVLGPHRIKHRPRRQ